MEHNETNNKVITTKQKINEIDYQIYEEKRKMKKINNIQENIAALSKNMSRCVDLLSKSIKGPTTKNIFDDMHDSNRIFYIQATCDLDELTEVSQKKINTLSIEKDKIIKESKNQKE